MTLIVIVLGLIFVSAAFLSIMEISGKPAADSKLLIIIPLKKGVDNAEILLRQALSLGGQCRLILLDMGVGAETLEICRRFSNSGIPFEVIPWKDDGITAAEIIRGIALEEFEDMQ